MKRLILTLIVGIICFNTSVCFSQSEYRSISADEYIDKLKAGWVGQMAGVGWGWPTEFRFKGIIVPEEKVPEWKPETINQFRQDDIYVEMTFLRTLEIYGLDVSSEQAGIDFANSSYPLFHANYAGRDNLRDGISPPDSGHPKYNEHADDIDYQIEADFSGLIAPGLPNTVIELGEKFGRMMNYGDGLYGGQFVGGMYAEAFFESDMEKVIEVGLRCIPPQSQYYECITDVLQWYHQYPNDWVKTWQLVLEKYHKNPDYRKGSCDKGGFNIDAKINGAYIVIGLLYGKGDIDKTIVISMRCGQDSDCNPSSAAGILCTAIGFSKLPEKYTSALKLDVDFVTTSYNFVELIHVCETLTRQVIIKAGGRIQKSNASGGEVFVIPVKKPEPGKFVQCWEPGPVENSKYTEEQMVQMNGCTAKHLYTGLEKFAPGWKISRCGNPLANWSGFHASKENAFFVTCPLGDSIGCVLSKNIKVPAGKKNMLKLTVGHEVRDCNPPLHLQRRWQLIVKANDKILLSKIISKDSAPNNRADVNIDISKYAGEEVNLELVNQQLKECDSTAYWYKIEIIESGVESALYSPEELAAEKKDIAEHWGRVQKYVARPDSFTEKYRNQFHFSVPKGVHGDVNGLVYFKGKYHLYYQFAEVVPGGVSMAHAVSDDLVHWKYQPMCVRPDHLGNIMSGTAVVDKNDTSGFFNGGSGIVALQTQRLGARFKAPEINSIFYSKDSVVWSKYEKNPALPNDGRNNIFRDPKIFRHEPTKKWIAFVAGQTSFLRIYSSSNLRDWQFESLRKDLDEDWLDCPDIFQLPIDGNPEKVKWVFLYLHNMYIIGDFDGHQFIPEPESLKHPLKMWYCEAAVGQTFNNMPPGDNRVVAIANMPKWGFRGGKLPTEPWPVAMTIPVVLELKTFVEGVRMVMNPVRELESLRKNPRQWKNVKLIPGRNPLEKVKSGVCEIIAEFELGDATEFGCIVRKGKGQQTVVGYDVDKKQLFVDRTKSGATGGITNIAEVYPAPLTIVKNRIKMRIFVDNSALNVFGNDGRVAFSNYYFPDPESDGIEVYVKGGDARLVSLDLYDLKSMWKDE